MTNGKKDKQRMSKGRKGTSREAVWKRNKVVLWYYPAAKKNYQTPLLLIYSLINEPYILDLSPGMSMIETFTKQGYDVYLLDFGKPGYEDKDVSLDDYITNYIQHGVERTLRHANTTELSMIGYCLGGTLTLIYTALANDVIKNLILFAPPIDFSRTHTFSNWVKALKIDSSTLDQFIDDYGLIPSTFIEAGLRMATSPLTFGSKLASLKPSHNERTELKHQLVKQWLTSHIPFSGATLKQLISEIICDNKLVQNQLKIAGQTVHLSNIKANLLVLSTTDDEIVPEEQTLPVMKKVSSPDKTYERIKGGHISLALKGKLPDVLELWLDKRSIPL
ncbi:alpha/beta fold hydrolase [Salipaludibacillus sp. HK11]|uniref:alpha/beta fold hydrolase n=1 Tax=Salipaludibacillus sp. HK11 TaxID=3394320 RepID=UPI0039FC31B2